MFTLAKKLNNVLEIDSEVLHLNLSFDAVLRYFELIEDDDFSDYEKLEIAFEIFAINYEIVEDFEQKQSILNTILKDYLKLSFNESSEATEEPVEAVKNKKVYDFTIDAGSIYASFLQDYQMDLIEQKGKLHWLSFLSLFENLTKNTKMSEIIGYRTMKIPSGKGTDPEYRKYIIAKKRQYRLGDVTMNEEELQGQLSKMFNFLKGKAKKK